MGRQLGNKRSCLDEVGKEWLEIWSAVLALTTRFLLVLAGVRLMGMQMHTHSEQVYVAAPAVSTVPSSPVQCLRARDCVCSRACFLL